MYQRVLPAGIESPRVAERAWTAGSPAPKFGAVIEPPEADFVYKRLSEPPTQRTPCP